MAKDEDNQATFGQDDHKVRFYCGVGFTKLMLTVIGCWTGRLHLQPGRRRQR